MNSPDQHFAGNPGPDDEDEEVCSLRGQIADIVDKLKNARARWSIAAVIAVAGLLAPIGMVLLFQSINGHRFTTIDATYFKTIEKIADGVAVPHPPLDWLTVISTVEKISQRMDLPATQPNTREQVKNSLDKANGTRDAELEKLYVQFDDAWALAFGLAALGCWMLPLVYVVWIALWKRMMERAKYQLEHRIVEAKARHLQDKLGEDFFTRLVQINFKYLDQYYFQTHQQANKSFALSVAASIVGLAIIVAAIGMVLYGKKEPAVLTAVVGGLSQFIAAVFFYLYNRTVLKMGEYHKKLVLTQNIGIALKITDMLPLAEKAQTQRALVGQLTFNINQYLSEIETSVKVPVAAE